MKVVLTGGGTAGHVLPAITIGKRIEEKMGADLHFIGNKEYIEKKITKEYNIPFTSIHSQGLEGKNAIDKWGGFAIKNTAGTLQAIRLLRNIKPDLVVATGGFVSAPVMAASVVLGIPYILHEQNSVVGKVNKLFLHKAKRVYTSINRTEGIRESVLVGNPVRYNERRKQEGDKLVVLGGSGGSEYLNKFILQYAKKNPSVPIVLQAGQRHVDDIKKEAPPNLEVLGYVDLGELYASAKVVIARGGTGTLFELANQCIPSVIVPLPTSADNHQYKNALHFADFGGMEIVEQKNGSDKRLEEKVKEIWENTQKRAEMNEKLDANALRNSDLKIVEDLLLFFSKGFF